MAGSEIRASDGRYPSVDDLLAQASANTGLIDFGPGDFREGLDWLLKSVADDAEFDPSVDEAVVATFRRRLENRLHLEAWLAKYPETLDAPVLGPVDIIGLPRTGTTALANMMSLDLQFRCLRSWEQAEPIPPPTPSTDATDARRLRAAEANKDLSPELLAMHLYDLDATTEDSEVLGMAFHGQQYTLPVYSYHQWWRSADFTETFRYHRRVIQVLQSQYPPQTWLFKSPHHKFHLEPIVAAYPDVRFVMTHRDPAKSVPSYSSLVSTIFPLAATPRDLRKVGPQVSNHLRVGMEQAIAARERLGEERFFDVHHNELARDPIGVLRKVYDFLGLAFTDETKVAVEEWQKANRLGAHGEHRYTPEQFGLSAEEIRADYAFYIDRFGVELEG